MKFLFDYFPIICFFLTYKIWDIYVATVVTMIASVIQVIAYWLRFRSFEKFHIITLILILLLGSFTLIFHNEIFIKWKPTIVYWAFGIALLSSHFIGKQTLMHRILKEKIELPNKAWSHLNFSWALFFIALGVLNLIIVYHFDTNTWVNFKLFGTLGLMLLFILGQAFYIARHLPQDSKMDVH